MGRVGFFGTAPLLFIFYNYKLPLFYRELKSLHCGYKIINTYKIKLDHIRSGTERFTKCKIKCIQTVYLVKKIITYQWNMIQNNCYVVDFSGCCVTLQKHSNTFLQ